MRIAAGVILALSNFMVVLDLTIANVSVPHIAGNLGISFDEGTWIITSYAVSEAICVPLTGWLAERFGAVRIFLLAMLGFGVFSLLCGLSMSLGMIVVCRIGQGLCGGPIMPMSQTLLVRVFPPRNRPMAMAIWAMTTTLGPAAGPIIGGLISDDLSWHWIFFINVPIAVVCTMLGWRYLRAVETERRRVPIDRVGLGLLILWIGALQIMLDTGRDRDWFGDWRIVALALVAVVGFAVFVIWELTEEHPIVDLRVFRYRAFSTTVVVMAFAFGAFFAGVVAVPQWLQMQMGYTATQAGFITALNAFVAVIFAQTAARLLPRVDPRLLISGGTAWMGLMALARAGWTSGADWFSLAWPMGLMGVGIPFMMIPLTTTALSAVAPEETASAAGLQNFVRSMAVAVSTSAVLTIWDNSQTTARSELVGRLHPAALQSGLSAMGMSSDQTLRMLSSMVDGEATTLGLNHAFQIAAGLLFFASALVWLTPRIPLTRLSGPAVGH
ncbi:MAG: DHA2 family efflux MFS transporter permease subunit [Sphingomonadales bacterium]|nr:DHA2 family efflux MFS transporter permease subunit [Sphingomonadales bacterium]